MDRRDFLTGSVGAALLATLPADVCAQTGSPPRSAVWDSGRVRHLLPTVSDTRMLIKVSLMQPLSAPPVLRVGGRPVAGRMNDTGGEFWQFHIDGLEPGRRYALSLAASGGAALCQPWDLSTFPDPNSRPTEFRVLFFTCACGHDAFGFLPASIRSRLLHRALSFRPHAAVANGDHVYWDLLAPRASPLLGASPQAARLAGTFTRSALSDSDGSRRSCSTTSAAR